MLVLATAAMCDAMSQAHFSAQQLTETQPCGMAYMRAHSTGSELQESFCLRCR